jgi:hypothetical protein
MKTPIKCVTQQKRRTHAHSAKLLNMADENLAKFVKSSKGGMLLNINNYLYRKDYSRNLRSYYKCNHLHCTSRAIIENARIVHHTDTHIHATANALIDKKTFTNELKETAIATPQPVPQLYRMQVATNDNVAVQTPPLVAIKDAVYRARKETLPPIPQTAEEFVMDPVVADRCIIFETRNNHGQRIIGITSRRLLQQLAECERIQFDGTFDSVPNIFAQLYILHGKHLGVWQPMVFFLLPSKHEDTYQAMWRELHRQVRLCTGHDMRASYALGDFEMGALNAVQLEWPNVLQLILKCCIFHFDQAILRKTKELGLWNGYLNDPDIKQMIRRFMAMPLMPLDQLDDVWLLIIADSPAVEHPLHVQCVRFQDYIVTTWLENNALFPKELWNHYAEDSDRTTNAAESSHHRINGVCGKHRLNIHAFCREIRNEIINAEIRIAQLNNGEPPPRRKKITISIQNRLTRFRNEFEGGVRNLQQFLDASSFQLHDHLV